MFVHSVKNGNNDTIREPLKKYYMSLVETRDFNGLIDNKPFFDQPLKNKQEAYEKLIEMAKNDNYTTGNYLDYLYHQKYYKLIGIDLLRQKDTNMSQQINFTGKLEEDNAVTMFYIAVKQQKTILIFLDSLIITE